MYIQLIIIEDILYKTYITYLDLLKPTTTLVKYRNELLKNTC